MKLFDLLPVATRCGVIALLIVGGCQPSTPLPPPGASLPTIDLFMSRSSLLETEFEQYSISDDSIFSECGAVERGRFVAKTQTVADLDSETKAELLKATYAIEKMLEDKRPTFDPPGTTASPFDPGTFALKCSNGDRVSEVKTSFDAVVNGETRASENLLILTKLLRGAALEGCGKKSFYGLRGARP